MSTTTHGTSDLCTTICVVDKTQNKVRYQMLFLSLTENFYVRFQPLFIYPKSRKKNILDNQILIIKQKIICSILNYIREKIIFLQRKSKDESQNLLMKRIFSNIIGRQSLQGKH
ncbi:hypothetical protein BpHYR1_009183 [Brachionus plicatilis]|uniref:Uncharacterized protein n=1 Tax=Brachionus plicatilis TaxID=10195 RepID=A0A3M7RNJ5_BRAPC|nr:hypothetical protein BpHYR1_009183 [Brachionus plicatilis]